MLNRLLLQWMMVRLTAIRFEFRTLVMTAEDEDLRPLLVGMTCPGGLKAGAGTGGSA